MDLTYWRAWVAVRWQLAGQSQNQRGANLVEYILLIAFIAIIVIVAVKVLGRTLSKQFSSANSNLN
jgi:Flp pilus assembly pilin Flp